MYNKRKKQRRVTALVLSFVMIMTMSFSTYAMEQELATNGNVETQSIIKNNTYTGEEETSPTFEEDVLLRDAFTKHGLYIHIIIVIYI